MHGTLAIPERKKFVFTILDDTDVATVENVAPVYALIEKLALRTTKTVWTCSCPEGSEHYGRSQTLDDPEYLAFSLDLQRRGFELASHGATMESSTRARTVAGLQRFREVFGHDPKVYANHGQNRENLYWGRDRFDDRAVRAMYGAFSREPARYFQGHVESSPYWWGDLCAERVTYVRNLTFNVLNVLKVNPSMPYRDRNRPAVQWWFSTANANNANDFVSALTTRRLDELEAEGGVCILTTHLGKGYTSKGKMNSAAAERLEDVAGRKGWFAPVGTVLDWLRSQRRNETLPAEQWRRMQWRYARDTLGEHLLSAWNRFSRI